MSGCKTWSSKPGLRGNQKGTRGLQSSVMSELNWIFVTRLQLKPTDMTSMTKSSEGHAGDPTQALDRLLVDCRGAFA